MQHFRLSSLFSGLGPPTQKSPQRSPVFNVALNENDENENRRNVEKTQRHLPQMDAFGSHGRIEGRLGKFLSKSEQEW